MTTQLASVPFLGPFPGPGPQPFTPPVIDNIELTVRRDVGNAEVTLSYDINWPEFAQATNLEYREVWQLVGNGLTVYTSPISLRGGLRPNGNASTHREHEKTIDWDELNVNPSGPDEIVAVITLTPLLPTQVSRQSAPVTVNSP
jgi:hypothetical protein